MPNSYLDSADIRVLGDILVLIQGILGQLSLLLLDGEFNKEYHNGFERHDRDAAGALRGDMFVKQGQGRRGLVDPDELVGALQDIFGFLVRRRRLQIPEVSKFL